MEILKLFGVAVLTLAPLFLLDTVEASFCPERHFLEQKLQRCVRCSECSGGEVVVRPCERHRDTHCGPISELVRAVESGRQHRHGHGGRRKEHNVGGEGRVDDIVWRYGDDVIKKEEPVVAIDVSSSEAPFSGAETLVWDWQAIALTSAVFACILFFLAITFYSLHQAKQWRRLKENFEADVEELSARLSLMAASSCSEKGELLASPESIGDSNYLNNRCVYLEQLLSVRNDEGKSGATPKGNVYIEENNSKTS